MALRTKLHPSEKTNNFGFSVKGIYFFFDKKNIKIISTVTIIVFILRPRLFAGK